MRRDSRILVEVPHERWVWSRCKEKRVARRRERREIAAKIIMSRLKAGSIADPSREQDHYDR